LATDGSEDAKLAARDAIDLSDRTGAQLHIAHAWQAVPPPVIIPEYYEEEGRRVLEEQAKLVADAGAWCGRSTC
jgi:nucleotide-binding universal stress UspA family protein